MPPVGFASVPVSLFPGAALQVSLLGSGGTIAPRGSLWGTMPVTGAGVLSVHLPVQPPTTPTEPALRVPADPVKLMAPGSFESTTMPQFGAVTLNEPCKSNVAGPVGANT